MTTVGITGAVAAATPEEALAAAGLWLARRFESGATMWCVAPEWPAHARHVAVEFVHPVIVGKRALPAVAVDAGDAIATVRLLARPGDVMALVASGSSGLASRLVQHARAWGLGTLWLGAGARPAMVSGVRQAMAGADHEIWAEGDDAAHAARSGDVVVLYHLLWELTHVVFEHPGLLVGESTCRGEVCVTCADEGRVGEIRVVRPDGTAEAVVEGEVELLDASLVAPVSPGDLVLAHAGVVLVRLDEGPVLRREGER